MKARDSSVVKRKEKKTEDLENVFFNVLAKNIFLTSKSCSWPTFSQIHFLKRQLDVTLLCYITKSRLDIQFFKKSFLQMVIVISQQIKEEEYDQS